MNWKRLDAYWLVEKRGVKEVHLCQQRALGCCVSLRKKLKVLRLDLKLL